MYSNAVSMYPGTNRWIEIPDQAEYWQMKWLSANRFGDPPPNWSAIRDDSRFHFQYRQLACSSEHRSISHSYTLRKWMIIKNWLNNQRNRNDFRLNVPLSIWLTVVDSMFAFWSALFRRRTIYSNSVSDFRCKRSYIANWFWHSVYVNGNVKA